MIGRRSVSVLVGLWAVSAFAQAQVFQATSSIKLDGGQGFARAYIAHVQSSNKDYALVNAGQTIQVFNMAGVEQLGLEPPVGSAFATFALINSVQTSSTTQSTILAAGNITGPLCAAAMCLEIYAWDDTAPGFHLLNTQTTSVLSATAMAIQSQSNSPSSPFTVYYATANPLMLYGTTVTVSSSDRSVTFGIPISRSIAPPLTGSTVLGLAVEVNLPAIYLSDDLSNLYTFPMDVTNLDGGIFAQRDAGYSSALGLYLTPPGGVGPFTLFAGGLGSGVYELNPNPLVAESIINGSFFVLASDGGTTFPSANSVNDALTTFAATEDDTGNGAFLHLGPAVAVIDAGPQDGGGADAGGLDAGSIPTIPIIGPGPGAAPAAGNSCNCSSAGGAPLLLVFLLPLFAPRRRR
jgi:hypothetical protein